MAKHTDFGRIGGGSPAPKRRRDARAALFTDPLPHEADPGAEPVDLEADPAPDTANNRGALDEGWFVMECSACHTRSRMGAFGLVVASLPSLYLPFLKQDYPSLMRCPSCRSHQWVRVRVDLDI